MGSTYYIIECPKQCDMSMGVWYYDTKRADWLLQAPNSTSDYKLDQMLSCAECGYRNTLAEFGRSITDEQYKEAMEELKYRTPTCYAHILDNSCMIKNDMNDTCYFCGLPTKPLGIYGRIRTYCSKCQK
jgi:hypothetical protein